MKKLDIKKFLILNSIKIEYTDLLVIIGPQAQGKSIISKLLYFFESIDKEIISNIILGYTKSQLNKELIERFLKIFTLENLINTEIDIFFKNENFGCSIFKAMNSSKINIVFDEKFNQNIKNLRLSFNKCKKLKEQFGFPALYEALDEDRLFNINIDSIVDNYSTYYLSNGRKDLKVLFKKDKEDLNIELIKAKFRQSIEFDKNFINISHAIYIPAGRSFFANLQKSIFNFLTNNLPIEYFLKEFGAKYERLKNGYTEHSRGFFKTNKGKSEFDAVCLNILGGNYVRQKDRDYIKSKNGDLVNLEYASSGQQEALPMLLTISSISKNTTVVIEEPEAHLYPSAQAEVVKLIGKAYNNTDMQSKYIITTHSPYILMSINNSIQGYNARINETKVKSVSAKEWVNSGIKSENISAYILSGGKIKSIIDEETGLINAYEIDQISSKLSDDFEELLGIED